MRNSGIETQFLLLCDVGDDQDLDDRVIRQLWEENQDLRGVPLREYFSLFKFQQIPVR